LAALQVRAEALAAQARDLDEEAQAFKGQIEALNHLLLG
jgi:prefoldin subunit 5